MHSVLAKRKTVMPEKGKSMIHRIWAFVNCMYSLRHLFALVIKTCIVRWDKLFFCNVFVLLYIFLLAWFVYHSMLWWMLVCIVVIFVCFWIIIIDMRKIYIYWAINRLISISFITQNNYSLTSSLILCTYCFYCNMNIKFFWSHSAFCIKVLPLFFCSYVLIISDIFSFWWYYSWSIKLVFLCLNVMSWSHLA